MKNITRINEITEQSGENSKVYLMSDGSKEMVLYTGEMAKPKI